MRHLIFSRTACARRGAALLFAVMLVMLPGCAPAGHFQCADALGCVDIAPKDPVKLGALFTLTGGSAPAGTEELHATQMALAARGNKLLGHPILLQIEDELCSSEGGANGALRIVADPLVVAILGTNCSNAAVTAGKIMSEKGLVMISSANTSPLLTSMNGKAAPYWYPGYFRTSWNDSAMGKAAAAFAYQKLGLKKAAVINAGDPYTVGLTDAFSADFTAQGGAVVLALKINENDADQREALNAVALSGAELVFMPLSHPETGSRIMQQAREKPALDKVVFIAGEAMLSDVFINQAGDAGVGIYILGPVVPDSPAVRKLRRDYKTTYGEEPPSFYYSLSYDAANLLLDAIQKVAVQDPDGTLHIGRQALRAALYATKAYPGISGQLSCDAFGDCAIMHLDIVELKDPTGGVDALRTNIVYEYQSR